VVRSDDPSRARTYRRQRRLRLHQPRVQRALRRAHLLQTGLHHGQLVLHTLRVRAGVVR